MPTQAEKAAFVGSATQHDAPLAGPGSPDVLVNNRPAWRSGDPHTCATHGPEAPLMGSETVKVNNRFAIRVGDFLQGACPPNRIMVGSPNVKIGTPGIGIASPAGRAQFCDLYCRLKADWPSLTPAEREQRYNELLAAMFSSFGAPPARAAAVLDRDGAAGASWDANHWTVNVPEGSWERDQPPRLSSTYHEIRHGEQTYRGLQHRGSEGALDVPPHVETAAANNRSDPNTPEGRFGHLHSDNEHETAGLENRSRIIREIYASGGTAADRGTQRYRDAVQGYFHQPGGQDAEATERAAGDCGCP